MKSYVGHVVYGEKVINTFVVRTWQKAYCRDQRKEKWEACPQYADGGWCEMFHADLSCDGSTRKPLRCHRCIEAFGEG